MINVVIREHNDNIVSFNIEGHALSKEVIEESIGEAYDLICNTVSTLSQSVIIGIEEVLKLKVNYNIDDGDLSLDLNSLGEIDILKCQVLLKTFKISIESSIKSLDLSFGKKKRKEYIKLKVEEVQFHANNESSVIRS
ncbi:ribosomal-processing cysteine protease Prp [Clostridium hydrogeniformans]|uniref:ribosomal-processing cysteine protease Prp n=1 Tax=Clostridium hydrogeniformans TaxID=349933 RepID=UPI00068BA847|nr:ribosomal-processing cysteine protease Prp [Clostridium hydrogeniformans]